MLIVSSIIRNCWQFNSTLPGGFAILVAVAQVSITWIQTSIRLFSNTDVILG
jgi:hypothetical protein